MSLLDDSGHILRTVAPAPSLDYDHLLKMGLAACQQLSGDTWTDYNEHDPGVTILEQLCYALTDLGYRCHFPMADLLALPQDGAGERATTLFAAPDILSCNAITQRDYRKLIIDQALAQDWPNFKNVWLEPISGEPGHYAVSVEAVEPGQDDATLATEVESAYTACRNVGEFVGETPQILGLCAVAPSATLALNAGADPEAVVAQLLFALQDCLVPFVQVLGVAQAAALGMTPDAIYNGPPLALGLIPDSQLLPPRTSVTRAELVDVMLGVAGVSSVSGCTLTVGGVPAADSAPVPAGQVARLTPSVFAPVTALPFSLVCGGSPLNVDLNRVNQLLAERLAAAAPRAALGAGSVSAGAAPQRRGGVADYLSIQRQFPAVYGLGEQGLALGQPQDENDVRRQTARRAMASQLKAYLLFFEQMLTDAQAQLAQAGRLFSLDPTLDRSYFMQSLAQGDGPPGVADVLCAPGPQPQPPTPAPDTVRHVVHVEEPAGGDTPLLRSPEFATADLARQGRAAILARGGADGNYRTRSLPGGLFQIVLVDVEGTPLAFGGFTFRAEAEALAAVPVLTSRVTALAGDPAAAEAGAVLIERGHCSVGLADTKGVVVLDGRRLSAAGQQRWVRQLFQFGPRAGCYRVQARPNQRWRLVLGDLQGRVFAHGDQEFATAAEAEAQIPGMAALVHSVCCDPDARARQLIAHPALPGNPCAPGANVHPDPDPRVAHYEAGWDHAVRGADPYGSRRNRVLDHLLAHFSESFDDLVLARVDPRSGKRGGVAKDLIGWKLQFLQRYARPFAKSASAGAVAPLSDWLGGARSRGATATSQSGPASRVTLLLGLRGGQAQTTPARYGYRDPATAPAADAPAAGTPQLRFTSAHPTLLRTLIDHGADPANYSVAATDGGHALKLQVPGASEPQVLATLPTATAAQQAAQSAAAWLRSYPDGELYAGESLHAVEHHHLKTGTDADQEAGFYAHRVSMVLPDWPLRFQDPAFRNLAWQTAVDNFPAHLRVHLHWLGQPSMEQFTKLHDAWSDAHSQGAPRGAAHSQLAAFLAKLLPATAEETP
ncbi:MAG TPA: hypothetical protein VFF16_04620 [Telluria sp.]|nr:hypothetical protein [Telluria sp.]